MISSLPFFNEKYLCRSLIALKPPLSPRIQQTLACIDMTGNRYLSPCTYTSVQQRQRMVSSTVYSSADNRGKDLPVRRAESQPQP